ncbi:Protein-tyrosine phosphatase-like protein [Gracilaria domingensis]|nr:Protein-tyrosine phosphatase-like protein [Gracilaria domingensis]
MAAFAPTFCLFLGNTRSVNEGAYSRGQLCGAKTKLLFNSVVVSKQYFKKPAQSDFLDPKPVDCESFCLQYHISASGLGEMSENSFNFSRVSDRDELAFGSARPGFPSKEVSLEELEPWVRFMKANGVKRVLSLLGDDEKDYYKFDIDQEMTTAFGEGKYNRTSVFVSNSRDVIVSALDAAHKAEEPIVIHCSGGEGRAAIGMSMWLTHVYGLSPEEAAQEIQKETDRTTGTVRRISAPKVAHLISAGTMTGFKK